jgi:cell division protein FtsL
MIKNPGRFVFVWVLAVIACASALVLYLGFRVRAVELGYELGELHKQSRHLREMKHVLELEVASYETPERVEFIARSLLGLSEPSWDRVIPSGALPPFETRAESTVAPQRAKDPAPLATPSVITGMGASE